MPKRAELVNEIIEDLINEVGFNEFIDGYNNVNVKASDDIFEESIHIIKLLEQTKEIVIKRNKPEEISYFNELLREYCFKLMEHIHIEEKTTEN